jgi:hypothetical protein
MATASGMTCRRAPTPWWTFCASIVARYCEFCGNASAAISTPVIRLSRR